MSEMVERVARAMYASDPCTKSDFSKDWRGADAPVPWEEAAAAIQMKVEGYARAAIAAMREPTNDMFLAGDQETPSISEGDYDRANRVWRAMIDEALR